MPSSPPEQFTSMRKRTITSPEGWDEELSGPPELGEEQRLGPLLPGGRRAAGPATRTCEQCGREYDWNGVEDDGAYYCCEACCLGEACDCDAP